MATHTGSEGKAFVGANQVAEVVDFSFDESTNLIPDHQLVDTESTYKAGRKNVTGVITCHWDETDTLAQGAMVNGAEVTLNLYPEGNASGAVYWTGSAIIQQVSRANADESIVSAVYNFTVNGSWTRSTVA